MTTRPRASIDLAALAANWRILDRLDGHNETAAVVKADAYGHGAERCGRALHAAGCRTFFVAHVEEGVDMRRALSGMDAQIFVFHGATEDDVSVFLDHDLTPIINTPGQLELHLSRFAHHKSATLHVDTGINRLGLRPEFLTTAQEKLGGDGADLILGHYACADTPDHPLNALQAERFAAAAALFPNARTSLPNSAGVVLPFPSDLARPGIALYGGGHDAKRLGLRPVMTVDAPVLSVFGVNAGDATGYGATARFDRPTQLATIAFGYADGLPRSASNSGFAILNHEKARLVGRVSMDLCTVALSGANSLHIGDRAEFWGVNADLEEQAVAAKTLGYELLTGLGPRVERIWTS